ncbi:hypothetical protein LEP1GSC064_2539 [Leptospira kirschneri serovar Grippotyphosa str. Moskva]|nr:hypothetical protein LEP1GSC064_2539 [Leptospira kirschneri serovar Grippotyphosa str. Moskva]
MEHPLAPPIDFPLEEVKRRIKSVQSVSGIFIESALKLQKDLKTFSFSTETEERDQIHKADEMMGKFIVEYLRQNFLPILFSPKTTTNMKEIIPFVGF